MTNHFLRRLEKRLKRRICVFEFYLIFFDMIIYYFVDKYKYRENMFVVDSSLKNVAKYIKSFVQRWISSIFVFNFDWWMQHFCQIEKYFQKSWKTKKIYLKWSLKIFDKKLNHIFRHLILIKKDNTHFEIQNIFENYEKWKNLSKMKSKAIKVSIIFKF